MRVWIFLGIIVLLISRLSAADQFELVANGDVENGTSGWSALWTRDPSSGTATIEKKNVHGGAASWRVAHHGVHDWSLAQEARWTVTPGDILTLSAWVRFQSGGAASLGFFTRTADDTVVSWDYAGQNIPTRDGWQHLTARLIIPASTATVQFRLIGTGPCVVDLDDVSVMRSGTVDGLRTPGLPPSISITDARLMVTLNTHDATLTVIDRRTGRTWLPAPTSPGIVVLAAAVAAPDRISLQMLDTKMPAPLQ